MRGLTVELPTPAGCVQPVNEVSLRIGRGESLGLDGESGSGKTMLSLARMGLLPPERVSAAKHRWRLFGLFSFSLELSIEGHDSVGTVNFAFFCARIPAEIFPRVHA